MKHVYLAHEGGSEKRKQKKVDTFISNLKVHERIEELKNNN